MNCIVNEWRNAYYTPSIGKKALSAPKGILQRSEGSKLFYELEACGMEKSICKVDPEKQSAIRGQETP